MRLDQKTPRLSMRAHLDRMLATCASSRFALRTLRSHGLRPVELHMVSRATTVSSLMYASPAWWGFTDASERSRLNRLIAGLIRQVSYRLTSPHSRNWLAKLILAYSEQYAPIQIMSSGIISLLKNHPAIICVRVLTFSIFHPRTLGTLSHALFTEHCHKAMAT